MVLYYIYGLFNEDYPHTYIGHTKNLERRLADHKCCAKTKNSKIYKTMREVGGEWKMEVLECHECNKKYAKKIERYYIELMGDLNKEVPGRTLEEWKEDNRERRLENDKIWYKNNPEKVKAKIERMCVKHKLNRFTCQCGSTNIRTADRPKHEKTAKHTAYENEKKNI